MLHWYLRSIVFCVFCGCDLSTPTVFIPAKPLTEDQMVAIAKEDAVICNCGRDIESQTQTGSDGLD